MLIRLIESRVEKFASVLDDPPFDSMLKKNAATLQSLY